MSLYLLPIAYTLFVWWFSTGVIIYLDSLPRRTYRWTMLGTTVVLAVALYGLAVSSGDTTVAGAYHGFTCGLLIWGWLEVSFLLGFVTGVRNAPCPPGCTGWRRFGLAIQAVLHHELAIIAGAVVVVDLTWGGANQVGTWTFMVLWGMRCSAKLNLFLGAPNLNAQFLPQHLRFLESYLLKKPMNLLFPLSISVSSVVTVILVQRAIAADAAAATGLTFLAALMSLAILEHWFLVLPLPDAALWKWALRDGAPRRRIDAKVGTGRTLLRQVLAPASAPGGTAAAINDPGSAVPSP